MTETKETKKKETVVGIDLGTTNSAIAYMVGGRPEIIPNSEGGRITPSYVSLTNDGEWIVGVQAKRQAIANAEKTVIEIKRKMGTDYKVKLEGKDYRPEEISARVLAKMKADAEEYLGQPIKKAVITVPAYFSDSQRQATKDAGEIAGLEVLRIVNEPTASALAYGLDREGAEKVLVWDLGGGTFDVSILELDEGLFRVISTSGNNLLGGSDWDKKIIDWLVSQFKNNEGIDVSKDLKVMQRLKDAAEQAKIELSTKVQTQISLPYLTFDPKTQTPKHLDITLTRAKFEEMTEDLVQKCIDPAKQALKDSKLSLQELDKVILVGGATRMPMIQKAVKELFGKEPEKGVQPDEVVALGAAVQAAVLAGEVKDILLLDVTPLTLGVETLGGVMTSLIDRNTTIPVTKKKVFTTAADGQPAVEIHVLQGERAMAADNVTLGTFQLVGLPPAPRGVPQIEVSFDIDANGILNVTAKDLGTGKQQTIVIQSSSLSDEDVERMKGDAEKFKEEDEKRKEMIETKNNAEQAIYTAEKTLKDLAEKVEENEKQLIEEKIAEVRTALESENNEDIKNKTDALLQEMFKISQRIYQATGEAPPGGVPPGGVPPGGFPGGFPGAQGAEKAKNVDEGDVIDVDYEPADEE